MDEAHAWVERAVEKFSDGNEAEIAATLSRVTGADLTALKKKMGARAGGPKAELARKLAGHVSATGKERRRWNNLTGEERLREIDERDAAAKKKKPRAPRKAKPKADRGAKS